MQTPTDAGSGPDRASGADTGQVRALNDGPSSTQQIRVDVNRTGDAVVLHVSGEVDLLTANVLGERLREQLEPATVLVLDLTGVSFLGSAGLAEIVSASQAGADAGARLSLVATSRAVLRPLEVTGLSTLLTVYETVDAALAADR